MSYPEHQYLYDDLLLRWKQHKDRSFPPGVAGKEAAGTCLILFDADLAALVGAYIKRRKLRPRAVEALREYQEDLLRIIPSLSGGAAAYFESWQEIVAQVVRLAVLDGLT